VKRLRNLLKWESAVGFDYWDDTQTARLRALWDEGASTQEMSRQLGRGKNAVVGKVHRLKLTPRPSPIIRVPGKVSAKPGPKPKPPALVSLLPPPRVDSVLTGSVPLIGTSRASSQAGGRQIRGYVRPDNATNQCAMSIGWSAAHDQKIIDAVTAAERGPTVRIAPRSLHSEPCSYLVSQGRPWIYCDAESLPGKVYCGAHHKICSLGLPKSAVKAPVESIGQ
jgi:GcrA cell cycle regulator